MEREKGNKEVRDCIKLVDERLGEWKRDSRENVYYAKPKKNRDGTINLEDAEMDELKELEAQEAKKTKGGSKKQVQANKRSNSREAILPDEVSAGKVYSPIQQEDPKKKPKTGPINHDLIKRFDGYLEQKHRNLEMLKQKVEQEERGNRFRAKDVPKSNTPTVPRTARQHQPTVERDEKQSKRGNSKEPSSERKYDELAAAPVSSRKKLRKSRSKDIGPLQEPAQAYIDFYPVENVDQMSGRRKKRASSKSLERPEETSNQFAPEAGRSKEKKVRIDASAGEAGGKKKARSKSKDKIFMMDSMEKEKRINDIIKQASSNQKKQAAQREKTDSDAQNKPKNSPSKEKLARKPSKEAKGLFSSPSKPAGGMQDNEQASPQRERSASRGASKENLQRAVRNSSKEKSSKKPIKVVGKVDSKTKFDEEYWRGKEVKRQEEELRNRIEGLIYRDVIQMSNKK